MAAGELPWSLGDALAGRIEGAETVRVDGRTDADVAGIAARAVGRTLVVVVRDPVRHRWQQPWLGLARAHPCAVVVDAGWPDETLDDLPVIRTRGIAPVLMAACADVLAEAGVRR